MGLSESYIHVAVRKHLKRQGWKLIAGQFPGGSDDELAILNVYDPVVATDDSPDPRRHSLGKLVPDLVALRDGVLLIVEAKPSYSTDDREKLVYLLTERRNDLLAALGKFALGRDCPGLLPVTALKMCPALAFSATSRFGRDAGFVTLRVRTLEDVMMDGPY